jgi:peptide-methionine (R)-S-oxide reductase
MPADTWKQKLSPVQYRVLRQKGTEPAFSGKYTLEKTPGIYACAACANPLFSSQTKYDSGSGWPSFYDVISEGSVKLKPDHSHGTERIEVICGGCGSHLGHLFEDGPKDQTGLRYCINSIALNHQPK